jgi:RNA polymerase sigma-70 factor, ECF subfamily
MDPPFIAGMPRPGRAAARHRQGRHAKRESDTRPPGLDRIKSARSRRERAHDASEIEFVAPSQKALADPADRVTFDDGARLALLVVLQQLSPAERVVFVRHDIFQMPFDTVAETVGRSAPACRQLASRARQPAVGANLHHAGQRQAQR